MLPEPSRMAEETEAPCVDGIGQWPDSRANGLLR
jgi:hypothetical protein